MSIQRISRRDFLRLGLGAGSGLVLGLALPARAGTKLETAQAGPGQAGTSAEIQPFEPNAFVRIGSDNRVTIVAKHLEMGQGAYTGLATVLAEELDAAWEQVDVVAAPADARRYNNLNWGQVQGTGGSTAMANSWMQLRKAGATARAMLVQAAADAWGVADDEVEVIDGRLSHAASGKTASFGDLAEAAAEQIPPHEVALKSPEQFRLIGNKLPRKDSPEKVNGSAIYTQDVKLPDMLTALVAHPPRFGGRVKTLDDSAARAVSGVVDVLSIPSGVAVLASDFWSASKGREALKIEWDETDALASGSDQLFAQFARLADGPGATAASQGDAASLLDQAGDRLVEAEYRYPFLAHASMEPMNCVVRATAAGVEVWNGEQMQTVDQTRLAELFGVESDRVQLHMLYAGGSFGRRANPGSDYVLEAANIAKAHAKGLPIKLVWTREDDMRAGYYRPMNLHRLRAVLGEDGLPQAWHHRIVGQSIVDDTPFQGMMRDGIDPTSVEGASNQPYAIPNQWVDLHSPKLGVPVQWWRSVGSTHTAYSVETFIDRLARKAGRDPLDYRLALLKDQPRHTAALKLVAERAGWNQSDGTENNGRARGRGIAVHESFGTVVAMVADVTMNAGQPKVEKVWIAVDCGIAINPDIVRAQMEGGMGFGLAMILGSQITLDAGRVAQSNFHDYKVLRLPQMPDVEVAIVPSANPPSGVGEPATPVIAPAVANAIAAATGEIHTRLPLA